MKPSDLATLALRLLAVFVGCELFAKAIRFLPQVWVWPYQGNPPPTWLLATVTLAPFVVAALIWVFAPWLGRVATRRMTDQPVATCSVHSLSAAAFAVTGLLLALTALPGLVGTLTWLVHALMEPRMGLDRVLILRTLAAGLVQLLVGIFLIVGAARLSGWLSRLRYMGTQKPWSSDQQEP